MNLTRIAILSVFITVPLALMSASPADARHATGLWNSAGKNVLPLQYDEIRRESNRFFAYKSQIAQDGKIVWTKTEVDSVGRVGTPQPSEPPPDIRVFSKSNVEPPEGWNLSSRYDFGYAVSNNKGQRGFVDASGKLLVIPDTMPSLEPIGPGLFKNQIYKDNSEPVTQLLDSNLNVVSDLPPDLELSGEYYSDGLLMVRTKSGIIAFLNTKGQYQIKPTAITNARKFINGFCEVSLEAHGQFASAIINKNGKIVAGPFVRAHFSSRDEKDQVIVSFERERSGVISVSGKVIIPFEYESISEHDGRYVGRKDGHCIIFSHDGKPLITFEKNISSVIPSGEYIIFAQYIGPKMADDGERSSLRAKTRTGVMRKTGEVTIPPQFQWTAPTIHGNLLLVYSAENSETLTGVVNVETGKMVMAPIPATVTIEDRYILASMRTSAFDAAQFKQSKGREAWSEFLQSYNLIGMPKVKIESLLGKPNIGYVKTERSEYGRYGLECGTCLNTWRGVDIEYDSKNRATGWREVKRSTPDEWHRDNVVLIHSRIGGALRTVPKKEAKILLNPQPKPARQT